jgi:outer membrane protein assembly factor BamB
MVYALDANTGDERWHFSLGSGLARWIFSAPVVQDGTVYAGVGSSFAALDAATGDDIWAADEMGGDWISCLTSPAVGGNSVFMGVNWSNGLFAIDKRTGKQVWNDKKGFGTSHSTPSFSEDMVYHAADGKLHAVEADSGEEKWGFDLPGGWAISSPAVSGGKVVVGGADGVIYSVDASTGKEAWHYQTGSPLLFFTPYSRDGGPIVSSPAIAGGFVYCGGVDGKLYALDFENGNVLWSYDLGVPITSSPAVSGNAVYVSTYDGTVFAFTQPGGSR